MYIKYLEAETLILWNMKLFKLPIDQLLIVQQLRNHLEANTLYY